MTWTKECTVIAFLVIFAAIVMWEANGDLELARYLRECELKSERYLLKRWLERFLDDHEYEYVEYPDGWFYRCPVCHALGRDPEGNDIMHEEECIVGDTLAAINSGEV